MGGTCVITGVWEVGWAMGGAWDASMGYAWGVHKVKAAFPKKTHNQYTYIHVPVQLSLQQVKKFSNEH